LIARFTRVAVPGVVVVLLAGLYNARIQVGSLGGLWGTAYGRTLLVKVLLVLVMLALGGLNNFYYGRRAAALVGGESGEEEARRGFQPDRAEEAALGVLVLLVTAALVFQTPARDYPGGAGGMATGPGVSRAP
jgi:copper transport protein